MNGECLCGEVSFKVSGELPLLYQCHCSLCGSPVPNPLRDTDLIWVPAGLLSGPATSKIGVHLHLSSAAWERESEHCLRLISGPDNLNALNQALQRKSPDAVT